MAETKAQRLRSVRAATLADVEGADTAFINILSRLPVKSILSFRTVSKHWYDSIRNKFFAKQQLTISRDKPCFIACPRVGTMMKLYSMEPGSFRKRHLITLDPDDRNDQDIMYMVSSFNGLICCINDNDVSGNDDFYDLQIRIINPCTREIFLLPQGTPSFRFEPAIGVAYGTGNNLDYKVFRFFCPGDKERFFECEVYHSGTGVWKNIGSVPCIPMYSHFSPFRSSHVFVGGKIYWLSSLDEPGEILSVDFEGIFSVIQLPIYQGDHKEEDGITEGSYLINYQGDLSIVILHPEDIDIWIWEKNCENYSWEHKCRVKSPFSDDDLVLSISSLKNHISYVTERKWCYYNMDTRRWKKGKTDYARFMKTSMFPFTESLLP
ncbi:hypothetical protein EUTSA_v10022358mg, partial [Eutrema salsugineum]